MTDIIASVQEQSVDSDFIFLFDLEYEEDTFARFTGQLSESLSSLQFRDSNGVAHSYTNIPVQFEGIDISADGAQARPTLTIANILPLFKQEIGFTDYEDLIGKRITRRTTMRKYLVGEPGDSGAGNPPVEFPKVTYIIDRIGSKSSSEVVFELAPPHDLEGIMVPRRIIIGGACPWKYTGADPTRSPEDIIGGCSWKRSSLFRIPISTNEYGVTEVRRIYVNKEDEYVLKKNEVAEHAVDATGSTLPTFALNEFYFTEVDLQKITSTGAIVADNNVREYWQCIADTTSAPSDSNSAFRRIRTYEPWTPEVETKAYVNKSYNEYVFYENTIWQVQRVSLTNLEPSEGSNWTRGDSCGKKLESCRMRYLAIRNSGNTKPGFLRTKNNKRAIPFGGFPGAKQNR